MKATPRIKHSCKSSPTLRGRNLNHAVPVHRQCSLVADADIVSFINVDYQGKEVGNSTLTFEPQHVISNNVAFCQVQTQTSLCSLILSLETPKDVLSVA